MNKILLLIFVLTIAFSCKKQDEFTITGEVEGFDNGMAYLLKYIDGERRPVDSAYMEDGRFRFTGSVDIPQFYHIGFEDRFSAIEVFLENSDIEVRSNRRNPADASVDGSSVHDEYQRFKLNLINIELDINDVVNDMEYLKRWGHEEEAERLRIEMHEPLLEKREEFLKDYVKANRASHVAAFVFYYYMMYNLETGELEELLNSFHPSVAGSPYLEAVEKELEKRELLEPGKELIDFTMEDPEGTPSSLTSYTGEGYLLVDFTASWSESCRDAIPGLRRIYSEYSDSGLDILSVSLDHDREEWLEFIEDERLEWNHVSDFRQWNSPAVENYLVRSIPHWLLISPDGKIVTNGMNTIDELNAKLDELNFSGR